MGRTKKIEQGPTDYELMSRIKAGDEKAKIELFNRYELLMFKQYHKLRKACVENKWTGIELGTPEDYKIECWEPYQKALDTTELSMIDHCPVWDSPKNKDETMTSWRARRKVVGYEDHSSTWKFYQTFWGYIKKMNEIEIDHYVKRCKAEVPMFTTSSKDGDEYSILDTNMPEALAKSPEDYYIENYDNQIMKRAIENSYKKFNSIQKGIWDKRKEEATETEIIRSLKISKDAYKANIDAMWNIYNFQLRREKIKS